MDLGAPFAPSSSPPSSPSFGPTDSSPASSPVLAPIILDSPPIAAGPSHPFAASSRSDRRPPAYEKKIATPPAPSSDFIAKAPGSREFPGSYGEDEYLHDTASGQPDLVLGNREASIWDEAISNAIDKGKGTLELSSQELTYIPQSIRDLGKFFVAAEKVEQANSTGGRLFSRTKTTPISTSYQSRSFERTASISESSTGLAREELQLYLFTNKIRTLPRELFGLKKMTVLSLRRNKLTYVPAEISLLTNLREFNISNNQLTYLPSEMLNMTLEILLLYPNPFRTEPRTEPLAESPQQAGSLHRRRSMTRFLSRMAPIKAPDTRPVSSITNIHPHSDVPSLFELCLRVLLSPCLPLIPGSNTNLAELYTLPIPGEWGSKTVPSSVQDILNACVPESVSTHKTMSPNVTPRGSRRVLSASRDDNVDNDSMGLGVCPNPSHRTKTVFVQHMEERFTWEKVIAGVSVGGTVPMKWRGCLKGCLVFLDSDTAAPRDPNIRQALGNRSGNAQMIVNIDDDVEMDDVVQPVSLARNGLDQDFEDDA